MPALNTTRPSAMARRTSGIPAMAWAISHFPSLTVRVNCMYSISCLLLSPWQAVCARPKTGKAAGIQSDAGSASFRYSSSPTTRANSVRGSTTGLPVFSWIRSLTPLA